MKFVSKDLALKLKAKGFDKPCFGYYYIKTPTGRIDGELALNRYSGRGGSYKETLESYADFPLKEGFVKYAYSNIVDAPTTDQVLEWLRDEKNVNVSVQPYFTPSTKNNIMWGWEILLMGKVIDCKNTLYTVSQNNFTKLASANCCESYDDACVDAIEFAIDNLI